MVEGVEAFAEGGVLPLHGRVEAPWADAADYARLKILTTPTVSRGTT